MGDRFSEYSKNSHTRRHPRGGGCEPVGRDFDDSSHEVRAGAEILLEIGAK
jgi:hypothetical protein